MTARRPSPGRRQRGRGDRGERVFAARPSGAGDIDKNCAESWPEPGQAHRAGDRAVALQEMDRGEANQLPFTRDHHVIGVLSRDDVITFFGTLQELGAQEAHS